MTGGEGMGAPEGNITESARVIEPMKTHPASDGCGSRVRSCSERQMPANRFDLGATTFT